MGPLLFSLDMAQRSQALQVRTDIYSIHYTARQHDNIQAWQYKATRAATDTTYMNSKSKSSDICFQSLWLGSFASLM